MIRIDSAYTQYREDNVPGYPGGKAVPVSAGNRTDGTPWRALWFNTILGFFQAIIVEAEGSFKVSGKPDKAGESDLLNAIKKIMAKTVNPSLVAQIMENKEHIAFLDSDLSQHSEAITNILEKIAGFIREAPDDGYVYGRKNKRWQEIVLPSDGTIGDTIKAMKVFSEKTIMLTNAGIADRRLKRYDIGLPYLSPVSEVYHFDTDLKNQNQGSSITIGYATAPVLVDREDSNGQIYLNPAVSDLPPYEPDGRSLYGRFSIATKIPAADSTIEFWIRAPVVENIVVFRLKIEKLEQFIFNIGGVDPDYSVAATNDIPYSVAAADDIPYNVAAVTQNRIDHFSPKGKESLNLANNGVQISANSWLHIAAVTTAQKLSLFIDTKKFDFIKHDQSLREADFVINEGKDEINVDELTIDRTVAVTSALFNANTENRIPYAALDREQRWSVLMFDNPNRTVTNLFESEQFRMAVKAVINNS
jgi:hypothetical protein